MEIVPLLKSFIQKILISKTSSWYWYNLYFSIICKLHALDALSYHFKYFKLHRIGKLARKKTLPNLKIDFFFSEFLLKQICYHWALIDAVINSQKCQIIGLNTVSLNCHILIQNILIWIFNQALIWPKKDKLLYVHHFWKMYKIIISVRLWIRSS